ncbi:hypothetical protein KY285_020504 [Solanum tuberosum]|nr:hypothetical protein KY285_020504 [Solanum tuberosum]
MMTEEIMFEYRDSLLKHLDDLPKYCANLLLPLMSDYKILRQVCGHLRDFYPILVANNTNYYYKEYEISQCSFEITSLLIDIMPLELELEDKNGDDPLDAKSSDESIESTSSSFVEVTVGHEEDEAWIIDQLLNKHESKLDVISIFGMPGLCKTTLANKVYKNTLVASHFNVRAWCTVSQNFNKSKVLQVILQQVAESSEGDKVVDLFERLRQVFGDQGSCPAELSEVGHQIVEKCQGLPLAVVLIAGVIVRGKKKEKDLWLKIQHNMDFVISANNNLQMMNVMQLSYDHLPYHLKSLLLYFGRSQKNKRTPVSKLMQLWMSEGFVDHYIPSKSSLEEITQSYLDALISSTTDALGKFPNLQHFDCNILVSNDPPTNGNWFPKFDVRNKLGSLILSYMYDWSSDNCLDYSEFEKIRSPNEYHFPTSLKELRLHSFPLRPTLLSAIATLPELEIQEIINSDFLEDEWDASEDIYQSLKTLHLADVLFTEWQIDKETFPKLVELILEHCNELTEIPSAFGDIDSLKSIRVVQTSRHLGNSAIEIKKDVEAYTRGERLDVFYSSLEESEEEVIS